MSKINIIIPMAGEGNRFQDVGIEIPKPLIVTNGKTLIEHSIESLGIDGRYIFITKKYNNEDYNTQLTNIFKKSVGEFIEIRVCEKQKGTSHSALEAKEFIDNDEELIITNCDQILHWDSSDFLKNARAKGDGAIVVHESDSHKHSYALIKDDIVLKLAEKNPISNSALVGLHYWKHGKDFVLSSEKLIKDLEGSGKESYISLTYNYMIGDGKTVSTYSVEPNQYVPLGTPRDIEIYESKLTEYYNSEKPKTLFIDIDGTTLKHSYHSADNDTHAIKILPGVLEKMNDWKSKGYCIVFTTARRGAKHPNLKQELIEAGIPVDQLITDIEGGQRFIINDKLKSDDLDRAIGINVITDQGFNKVKWEDYNL